MKDDSNNRIKPSGDYEIPDYKEMSFAKGEKILKEDDKDFGAYRILSGKVEVTKKCDDNDVSLAELEEGDIFGEMSLIDGQPHSATVTAVTDVECLFIDKVAFENEVEESSPIVREMIKALSQRLRGADSRICSRIKEE